MIALLDRRVNFSKVYAEGMRIAESNLPVMELPKGKTGKLTQPGLLNSPNVRRARRRMYRRLPWGWFPGYAPLCMDTNDPQTIEDAFAARLFRQVPPFDPALLAQLKEFVQAYVSHLPKVNVSAVDFEEWLATRPSYNEQRKQQLRDAYAELRGGPPTTRECRKIKSFGKSESYPCQKHMRMINSRSDAWKAFAGPYISACEEVVYTAPEFIKHTPVPQRPEKVRALKQAGRRYFLTDFTAYESHFVPAVQDAVENVLFRHLLADWQYKELLCETNSGPNVMSTRCGVSAVIAGRRMSGDLWTSLGNGFTNLMLAKFIASQQGHELYGFVEGDDGLFATEAQLDEQKYAKLGFTIKIRETSDPCIAPSDMAFCGMIFAESGQIIKDPRRVLESFGWTQSFISAGPRIMNGLLKSKSLSLCYEAGQCPILGALGREGLRRTQAYEAVRVADGYHELPTELVLEEFSPAKDTRVLFASVFGIPIELQLKVEQLIRDGDMGAVSEIIPPHDDIANYENRYVVEG